MIRNLANAVGYQLVWLASIGGAGHGLAWSGPLAALVFVALSLAFSDRLRADLRLIPLTLAIGAIADTAWITLGWIDYNAAWPSLAFAPVWILGLWFSLALTLNHSFAFLKGRYALAALLGAVGGPLSYWSASRGFGAVHFDVATATVLGGLGVAWAVIFPTLMYLAAQPVAQSFVAPKSREARP